ncbi:hypothetical protein WA026_022344 [Henosepilachna vigintioctopunctata]|uniref:Uncharacterized protein n=1 Tax=Henosepilachna vigintioctopunctata TaxID=420089 RepID=A0AAW1UX59_9CUCU
MRGGVDKKCSIYSNSRRTRRWLMVFAISCPRLECREYVYFIQHEPIKSCGDRRYPRAIGTCAYGASLAKKCYKYTITKKAVVDPTRVLGNDMVTKDVQDQETRRASRICPAKNI